MKGAPRLISRRSEDKRIFVLHEDELEFGTGRLQRVWVEHPGAVVIVPILEGEVLLVRQYRHATGQHLLELPAGTLEAGEEPIETARRELQEECGYLPRRLQPLGKMYAAPGYSSEVYHFFRADDLAPSQLPADDDEEIEIVRIPIADAVRMALSGEFADTKTALGILWIR